MTNLPISPIVIWIKIKMSDCSYLSFFDVTIIIQRKLSRMGYPECDRKMQRKFPTVQRNFRKLYSATKRGDFQQRGKQKWKSIVERAIWVWGWTLYRCLSRRLKGIKIRGLCNRVRIAHRAYYRLYMWSHGNIHWYRKGFCAHAEFPFKTFISIHSQLIPNVYLLQTAFNFHPPRFTFISILKTADIIWAFRV